MSTIKRNHHYMAGVKGSSGKNTHDWPAIEAEFMLGPWMNMTEYLIEKGIPQSSNTNKMTKGWAEKKKIKRREIYEQVMQETMDKQKQNLARGYRNLLNGGVLSRLNNEESLSKMSVRDIETLWKILRTENGLATSIKLLGEDKENKFSWVENIKNKIKEDE